MQIFLLYVYHRPRVSLRCLRLAASFLLFLRTLHLAGLALLAQRFPASTARIKEHMHCLYMRSLLYFCCFSQPLLGLFCSGCSCLARLAQEKINRARMRAPNQAAACHTIPTHLQHARLNYCCCIIAVHVIRADTLPRRRLEGCRFGRSAESNECLSFSFG